MSAVMKKLPDVDVLYLIRARLDSGARRGAPQLAKDVRALQKAEAEIVKLRQQIAAAAANSSACIGERRAS